MHRTVGFQQRNPTSMQSKFNFFYLGFRMVYHYCKSFFYVCFGGIKTCLHFVRMFLVSLVIMFISTTSKTGLFRELSFEYYPVFRGMFLMSFFFNLYGVTVFLWKRVSVDYQHVFSYSYAHTYQVMFVHRYGSIARLLFWFCFLLRFQYLLQGSNSISIIVFTCFLLYIFNITNSFNMIDAHSRIKHLWPAVAFFFPVLLFVCPFDEITYLFFGVHRHGFRQRSALFFNLLAVIASPFTEVTFFRSFLADVLCSMPRVVPDLLYTLCIYGTWSFSDESHNLYVESNNLHGYYTCGAGSSVYASVAFLLLLLPYHIRFWQCCRQYYITGNSSHVANAVKYALYLFVAVLSKLEKMSTNPEEHLRYRVLWLCFGLLATMYAYYWDIRMDW